MQGQACQRWGKRAADPSFPLPSRVLIAASFLHSQPRYRVRIENRQTFERTQEHFGCMQTSGFVWPMRPGKEWRFRAAGDIGLKNFFRIIKIGNDDGETVEVFLEGSIQASVAGKETSHRTGVNGTDMINQTACQGQLRDVRIAQDFES